MLNLVELESRWLHYKIKSLVPYIIFSAILILIFILILKYFFVKQEIAIDNLDQTKKSQNNTMQKEVLSNITKPNSEIRLVTTEPNIKPIYTPESTKVLVPSMDFLEQMKNSSLPYYKNDEIQKASLKNHTGPKTLHTQDKVEEIVEEIILESTPLKENENEIVEEKSSKINIQRKNIRSDIDGIIRRFKKNNNPALSLFVARKYYELGDYNNAYNYALITNEINRDIESSWIIFAKSLVKLGKKKMAVKTLKEYTKHSQSSSANLLIDEIESGQFE